MHIITCTCYSQLEIISHPREHILQLLYLLVLLLYLPISLCILFHIHMGIDIYPITYGTLILTIYYIMGMGKINGKIKYTLWKSVVLFPICLVACYLVHVEIGTWSVIPGMYRISNLPSGVSSNSCGNLYLDRNLQIYRMSNLPSSIQLARVEVDRGPEHVRDIQFAQQRATQFAWKLVLGLQSQVCMEYPVHLAMCQPILVETNTRVLIPGMYNILLEHVNTLTVQFQTNMIEFVSIYLIILYYLYYLLHDYVHIMHAIYYIIHIIFSMLCCLIMQFDYVI